MSSAPSHIRHATLGDLHEVVELLVACDVEDVGEPDTTEADVSADWRENGFDLSTDAWVAENGLGAMIGYAYVGDQLRNGEIEADMWVHPQSQDSEVNGRLLGLIERRAAEMATAAGYGEKGALEVCSLVANRAKRDMLRQRGYAARRTVYRMRIDLTDAPEQTPVPEGVELKPFRQGVDEQTVYDTLRQAFDDHFQQSNESFEAWKDRLLGHPSFVPDLWLLAWHDDQPVGAIVAFDYGDLGWVQSLGVLPQWRQRGIAAAMLSHVFAAFAQRGQTRVELGVDAEGETRPLRAYESVGMRLAHAYELLEKRLAS